VLSKSWSRGYGEEKQQNNVNETSRSNLQKICHMLYGASLTFEAVKAKKKGDLIYSCSIVSSIVRAEIVVQSDA